MESKGSLASSRATRDKTSVCNIFKYLCLFIVTATMLFSPVTQAYSAQATLSWNASTSPGVSGYKLYYGTASGAYSQSVDAGNTTSYTVASLADGQTYYFAAKAYNSTGNLSAYSSETSYATPGLPPLAKVYTISASAGSGGSISPAGSVAVSEGVNQSYSIVPNTGYKIAGVTVDGVSYGALSTYTFSNIAANHTISASFVASATPTVGTVVFADNAGGTQFKDSTGVTYLADSNYSGGSLGTLVTAIGGTVDDTLYHSSRLGTSFYYNIPLANGNYSVTLKAAEVTATASGQRVFSVKFNGQTVISNLDMYAKVGKNAAYDVTIPVSVTNGALKIDFIASKGSAKISAILVKTASLAAAPIPTVTESLEASSTPTVTESLEASSTPTVGTVVFADNAGGTQFKDSTGVTYLADSNYSGGSLGALVTAIGGTVDDTLYHSSRLGTSFYYNIPLANGNYSVTLKAAEVTATAPGQRVFSVKFNDQTVISNMDLYAIVGKNAAYDVTLPVSVTNGALKIDFIASKGSAKVSAILVKSN